MKLTSVTILMAAAFTVAACWHKPISDGTTTTPSPQATVNGQITFGVSGSGQRCTGSGVYRIAPVNITGTAGRRESMEGSFQWSGVSEQITGGELVSYGCVARFTESGVAIGTWRITASSGGWTAQCQRQLASGFSNQNQPQFYVGAAGCGQG
jgi:hypothetical protein